MKDQNDEGRDRLGPRAGDAPNVGDPTYMLRWIAEREDPQDRAEPAGPIGTPRRYSRPRIGLSFEAVADAFDVLLACPRLAALTITEINPPSR